MTIDELYQIYLEHPKVSKDTRDDVQGAIYFAIKGANFDGNDFAEEALSKGAEFAVVDDASRFDGVDDRLIVVDDALDTLQKLATYHRKKLNVPILAITGSNGKTTTKELVSGVLGQKYNVYSTPGNYNNHIGIPLSLLQVKGDTEFIVLEMGASAIGEIASYCAIAAPDYGLITNIGRAHLEGFGGIEGVKKGKGELFDYLADHNGFVFVNADEPYLLEMAQKVDRQHVYAQSEVLQNNEGRFTAQLHQSNPNVKCAFCDREGKRYEVESSLMGTHNFKNILTALAVGAWFNVPSIKMQKAIQSYRSENNRSQIIKRNSVTFLLDAYNANPTSMESMIRTFADRDNDRKGLILGDMLELGVYSAEAHQYIVDLITQIDDFEFVYLVGTEFEQTNCPHSFQKFQNVTELSQHWDHQQFKDIDILIKGSRSIQLEKLIQ